MREVFFHGVPSNKGANPAAPAIRPKFVSTVPSGQPPLEVSSDTLVENLNAEYLDSQPGEYYLNKYTGRLYVSVEGQDSNDGRSIATAVRTIKRAAYLASLTPQAETIHVLGGDYFEDNPVYLPQNTALIGDNLRATKVRAKNEGLDLFWVTSGCQLTGLVGQDNVGEPGDLNRGVGLLDTGSDPEINETTLSLRVFPGHQLKVVPPALRDSAGIVLFALPATRSASILTMLDNFPSFNPDDLDELETRVGQLISALSHDLLYRGNVRVVQQASSYRDTNGDLIPLVANAAAWQFALTQAFNLTKNALINIPNGYVGQITVADFGPALDYIDSLRDLFINIFQGAKPVDPNPGPGYILIDQEWARVQNFNPNSNILTLLERGIANPITGEPSAASRHINGAAITQGGKAFRYFAAFPDRDGYRPVGRLNLVEGSVSVTGIGTRFLDFYGGGAIQVGNDTYEIAAVDTNTRLVLRQPVAQGKGATNKAFWFIPKRETVALSPYVQNCSNISVLGHSEYNADTRTYNEDKTRAGGLLVDGSKLEPNTPLKSMVADAFTQIVFNGIGFHLKNDGYAQLVSVFQVFENPGVLCESGGYASISNSATNFGGEGLVAVGHSATSLPFYRQGQILTIQNITKADFNPAPSPIVQTRFLPEANETVTRALISVSPADINKFERGQLVTIVGHNSTPDLNAADLEVFSVQYDQNIVEIIINTPWSSAYATSGGSATGTVTITRGSVFTQVVATGFTRNPPSNYIVEIDGLPPHPSGEKYVVNELISELTGGLATFSLQIVIPQTDLDELAPSAPIQLFAPSIINSSSHTFEFVGAGINYTALPVNGGSAVVSQQTIERDGGRCYVSATDQDGTFTVGPFFSVNLRTGRVRFTGQVSVGVLDALELRSSPGIPIYQFSTDPNLGGTTNSSNTRLSTQKAIRDFVQNTLGNFFNLDKGTSSIPGLVVQLDSTGKINRQQLPALDPVRVFTVEDETERLVTEIDGITLRQGDFVVQVNPSPATVYVLTTANGLGGEDPDNWVPLTTTEINAAAIVSGIISTSRLGTGVANESTFLNGLSQFVPLPRGLRSVNEAVSVGSDGATVFERVGPERVITAVTYLNEVVTVTFSEPHGFQAGQNISINGVTPAAYNGIRLVATVTSTSLTFSLATNPGPYVSGGSARRAIAYRAGFIDLDVARVNYLPGQVAGTSNLGLAKFAYTDFTITSDSVVSVRDKSITLSRLQDIGARTLLGNLSNSPGPVQELALGEEIATVPTYNISLSAGNYVVSSEGVNLGALPSLFLSKGTTYRFVINTPGQPLYITTTIGQIGTPPPTIFSTGVTGNGITSGALIFRIPQNAPAVLYYHSGTSASNFGRIVLNGDVNEESLYYYNLRYN